MEQGSTATINLEFVYRAERLALTRLGFLLTGSREQAEDIVQSAFAALHQRWHDVDNAPAYLRRAVINLAHDTHRRRFRERLPTVRERTTEIPEIDETWQHIKSLPPNQRAVVVLRYYEDLPLVDIAALLDRPPATVRSDLRRALDKLRKVLT
jgi:RNA polymerase sigma factor (sigma-70 family)